MARLLHISPNIFPELAVEHSTKQIWKELAKDYEEYHILARSNDQHFHREQEGNLILHRVPKLTEGNKSFLFTSFLIGYYLKKYNIEIMLAQCAILGGMAGVFFGKMFKIPIMVEIHGVEYFDFLDGYKIKDKVVSNILRWVYGNAQRVRALNSYMKQMLIERHVRANIVIIQNRVNLSLFKPSKDNYELGNEICLICVGSFTSLKGHHLLIEAAKQLSKEYSLKVIIVGGGPLLKTYEQETAGLHGFEFYGRIPQEQLCTLLRNADIYVHTSYKEAVPRAIIEAMAMGLPIITTDVGMIRGLINDGENGMLISAGDEEGLEKSIQILVNDKELREKLGRQAYADACQYYEWNKNFKDYRDVLKQMLLENNQ